MLYFKHSELVDRYHVSLKTVHNWIDAAKAGKLELELTNKGGRTYIANNPGNDVVLERLAAKGKKYKNIRYSKTAEPTGAFYEIYNRKQILEIITDINVHREISRQYNYFDGGADNWDQFAHRLWTDKNANLLTSTSDLLKTNFDSIELLLADYERINIIDIGLGNALPEKEFIGRLIKDGRLNRYIAIDISRSMLDIAEKNMRSWFGDSIKVETHLRDITYERFDDLLVDDMLDSQASRTINVALLLGATPMNFRSPQDALKVVHGSLGQDDILVYTDKPDSEAERRYFDFNAKPGTTNLSPNHRFIFDLLNIDESLYDVEMAFNERESYRYIQVRLKKDLSIKFSFNNGERWVNLNKGEAVMLWRVWHMTSIEIISCFEDSGFSLLQTSLTKDRQFILTVFGVSKPR